MLDNFTIAQSVALFSIPLVSGFVGWGTNWLALKMTFYPIEYVGIRPFGWQGIIPSKVRKMAEKSVDLLTVKLLKIEEQFDLIDPARVAEEMMPALKDMSQRIIEEVMVSQIPDIWAKAPDAIKQAIYEAAQEGLPQVVAEMMEDIKANINELLDLKKMAVSVLMKDKSLVNQIFLRCGEKEFVFIERSGFYFGFLFGILQMGVFFFYTGWWILPIFGLLVGYATNWLALKLVFEPMEPLKIGPITIQGLFLKRQEEVSKEYSSIIASKIVTTERLFEFMVRGPGAQKLAILVRTHVDKVVDATAGIYKPIIDWMAGNQKMDIAKNIVFYRFQEELPIAIRQSFAYAEEALNLRNMLHEKMASLSPPEFEGFLRPAFQEDETTLILVGAFLGFLAGLLQFVVFFYDKW